MFYLVRILYCLSLCVYVLSVIKESCKKETWDKGKLHEEIVREKKKGLDSYLEESDVRAASRTVRVPSQTTGPLAGPSITMDAAIRIDFFDSLEFAHFTHTMECFLH